MRLSSVALTASLIMAGLMGCASSHTKPKHEYAYPKHAYSGTHGHSYSHHHGYSGSSRHGHHSTGRHSYPHHYHKAPPPPVPGRTPDGRYVLPGGLESVCAGGTPPPCQ
jgi:hypothetical protein